MGNIGMMFIPTDLADDVLKTAEENLGFTTKYPTLKILDNADTQAFDTSVEIGTGSTGPTVTFTHNLGYKPAYDIYLEDHDGRMFRVPGKSPDGVSSVGFVQSVSDSDLKIQVGYNPAVGHAHSHTRAILCVIYVESETQ